MSKLEFKKGDKIMFLGIFDNMGVYQKWAKTDGLVPLRVYEVADTYSNHPLITLMGRDALHHRRYFQKIEPEKEEQWNETKM